MRNALLACLFPAGICLIANTAVLSFQTPAKAVTGFTGVFAPSEFTFNSTDAASSPAPSVNTSNAATGTILLTGENNDSLSPGTTTWITTNSIAIDTIVSFSWSFAGDGFPFDPLPPGEGDRAGYVINGVPTFLANQGGASGNITSLTIPAGQTFGFLVETANNSGTAGVFTVNDFNATPVPLESDALPIVVSVGFLGAGVWVKRKLKGNRG